MSSTALIYLRMNLLYNIVIKFYIIYKYNIGNLFDIL